MKPVINEHENLSAYLDGELSHEEKLQIEKKLETSPSLRESLASLKKVKNSLANLPKIPADPYFETRLMERLKENRHSLFSFFDFRKPIFVFGALCLFTMAIFKLNPDLLEDFFKSHKSRLIDFYTSNLEPLLSSNSLTNEDIFRFAFSSTLPINKDGTQVLRLATGKNGEDIVEVQFAGNTSPGIELNKFVTSLGLNKSQQKKVDSILSTYSDKIKSAVLVNENNTLAINQSLWDYQNCLRADLLAFASEVSSVSINEALPIIASVAGNNPEFLYHLTESRRNAAPSDKYIFIADDTIFTTSLDINLDEIQKSIKDDVAEVETEVQNLTKKTLRFEIKKEFRDRKKIQSSQNGLHVFVDSNSCKVVLSPVNTFDLSALDSISIKLDSIFSDKNIFSNFVTTPRQPGFSFRFHSDENKSEQKGGRVSKDKKKKQYNSVRIFTDSSGIEIKSIDSVFNGNFQFPSLSDPRFADSLQQIIKKFLPDSTSSQLPKEFNKGMEEFRKEMEKMRKELEKLRFEFKYKDKDTKEKKSKEIKDSWEI